MFYLLLFSPLIGFFINGFCFKTKNVKLSGFVASSAVFLSLFSSVILFFKMNSLPVSQRSLSFYLFEWIHVGSFKIDMAFTLDPLSMTMVLIITGVGF